jgi:hypothetical protein
MRTKESFCLYGTRESSRPAPQRNLLFGFQLIFCSWSFGRNPIINQFSRYMFQNFQPVRATPRTVGFMVDISNSMFLGFLDNRHSGRGHREISPRKLGPWTGRSSPCLAEEWSLALPHCALCQSDDEDQARQRCFCFYGRPFVGDYLKSWHQTQQNTGVGWWLWTLYNDMMKEMVGWGLWKDYTTYSIQYIEGLL